MKIKAPQTSRSLPPNPVITWLAMRNLALGDVTPDDIRQMGAENETLFVEFKSSLDGEGYKVAEAVASFANTLGGWVLIGLHDDGTPSNWTPPPNVTDRVRQILDIWLDPLPAFAATLREHEGVPIGLIRVYESTDTPHVLRNGKVVVRSVAGVRNQTQVYRAGGVDTQIVLRQLADRGRQAFRDAQLKLVTTFLIQSAIGMTAPGGYTSLISNHVAVRAVPLVGDSLGDLAVSTTGRELLDAALCDLAGVGPGSQTTLRPAASGLVCEIQPPSHLVDGVLPIPRTAIAAADAAGVVAAAFRIHIQSPQLRVPAVTLDQFGKGIIAALLHAVVTILDRAELYGRSILELRIGDLARALTYDCGDGDQAVFPQDLPLGGELSLPLAADLSEVHALASQWRDDLGRAMGLETLRGKASPRMRPPASM